MSNLNDTSVNPQGVQGAYAGVANPSSSSTDRPSDSFATSGAMSGHQGLTDTDPNDPRAEQGALSGHVPPASGTTTQGGTGGTGDVIEGKPGVIESTELAPLGDDKVADDPGLVTQATAAAKKAYNAVMGDESK